MSKKTVIKLKPTLPCQLYSELRPNGIYFEIRQVLGATTIPLAHIVLNDDGTKIFLNNVRKLLRKRLKPPSQKGKA